MDINAPANQFSHMAAINDMMADYNAIWKQFLPIHLRVQHLCSMKQKPKPRATNQQKASGKRKEHPDRKLAGILYSVNGMSQKEIASELDLTEKTVGKWKDEDGWDALRQVQNLSPVSLIKNAYEQSELIYEAAKKDRRAISSKEADALLKLAAVIDKLSSRMDASTHAAAIIELGNYTKALDLDFTKQLARYGKEFVRTKLKG